MVGDGLIAAVLAIPEVFLGIVGIIGGRPDEPWSLGTAVIMLTALVFRRERTQPAAYLALAGLAVQITFRSSTVLRVSDLAVVLALYTLVAYVGRRQAALYTIAIVLLGLAWWFIPGPNPLAIPAALILLLCWLFGEWLGARRAYHAEVENRMRRLEFERDQQARLAVAEERNRIAREIHDVLAHSVSVMITQADGAAYVLRGKPELAEQAMHTIGHTGRDALTELRSLLGVLRNSADASDRAPQPTPAGLRDLTDRVRGLGLNVTLLMEGDFEGVPTGIGLGIYRIVQESLTNALKYGGGKPAASVVLGNDGACIDIDVTSDIGAESGSSMVSGGNGLIGMRERAAVYGGTLEAGLEGDGWRVHARIPFTPTTQH